MLFDRKEEELSNSIKILNKNKSLIDFRGDAFLIKLQESTPNS